jgi:hypothetical protein
MLVQDQQALAKWVRENDGPLDIAVAFWGEGAIQQLGLDQGDRSYRVILDLDSGGTNPKVVAELLDLRPSLIRVANRLHAKAFIGASEVLVGSANASANGLGGEGTEATRWTELGLLTRDPKLVAEAKAWFARLWRDSEEITPTRLRKAFDAWRSRQRIRPREITKSKANILDAARSNRNAFKNRGIYVVVDVTFYSETAIKKIDKIQQETGSEPYCWEGWKKMPLDSWFISFSDYVGEGLKMNRPAVYKSRSELQAGTLQIVDKSKLPEGYAAGSLAAWKPLLEKAKAEVSKDWKAGMFCQDLGEFVERFDRE